MSDTYTAAQMREAFLLGSRFNHAGYSLAYCENYARQQWPEPEPTVREVFDTSRKQFRSALSGRGGVLWRAERDSKETWDYRTYNADTRLALTRERILLWADLLEWPYCDSHGRPCKAEMRDGKLTITSVKPDSAEAV